MGRGVVYSIGVITRLISDDGWRGAPIPTLPLCVRGGAPLIPTLPLCIGHSTPLIPTLPLCLSFQVAAQIVGLVAVGDGGVAGDAAGAHQLG